MNKIVRSFAVVVLAMVSMGTFAQNPSTKFEVGIVSNNSSVSSSPVSGFSADGNVGFAAKFIVSNIPNLNENVEAVVGMSFQSMNLGLAGRDMGEIDSKTFTGGVRYRFTNEQIQPYVGVGVHYTSLNGSLANNTVDVNQKGSGFGTYLEVGIRGILPKNEFVDYVNVGVQHFSKTPFVLETSVGSAKISDVNLGATRFGISIGKSF